MFFLNKNTNIFVTYIKRQKIIANNNNKKEGMIISS